MKALILVLALIFGGFVTADAQTAETVNLRVNNTKKLLKSKLKIEFLSVVEDSRCPSDVNCIHAGNAQIRLRISKSGRQPKIVDLNSNLPSQTATFEGYEIKLKSLTPEPRSNIRINRSGYKAALTISKKMN